MDLLLKEQNDAKVAKKISARKIRKQAMISFSIIFVILFT